MDYQSVLNEVNAWPINDRIRLMRDVCDRLLDDEDEPELTEETKAEFDRRIEELDRNPEVGIPWEVAKARVSGRFQRKT